MGSFVGAGCGSALYFARTWPGATLFLFILVGRLIDWPGSGWVGHYLYGIALALPCIFFAWRGDDYIDVGCKAAVDLQSGWKDLFAGYLNRYRDFEYVPVKVVPAEGSKPLVVLPSGLRAFLPPMGDILAFWVRRPAISDPGTPRLRPPLGARAYPLASYQNYVFLPFDPDAATVEQRFQLFHEIGHALFARSFPSIGQVQTWPNLVPLTCGALIVAGLTPMTALPMTLMLIAWQSVGLLRTSPNFERTRYSELCADFYAMAHLRNAPETRPFVEKMIEGFRASADPAQNHRADDLEILLKTMKANTDSANSVPSVVDIEEAALVQQRLVGLGSQHPPVLVLILTICLAMVGLFLEAARPEVLLVFAGLYALVPFLIWRFGTGRRSALEGARVGRFLRQRQPTNIAPGRVPLSFS